MVNPFSDSTRKILNTKLGEFSFFPLEWKYSCTHDHAHSSMLWRFSALCHYQPCWRYLFYRSSFPVLSVSSFHPNSIGQIARFTQLIFYFLSHIVAKSHTWQGMLCYVCVFLCFSFTCVRFVPSTLRNYQIYRLSNLCTSIDSRTYTRRHSCPILCQSLPHSYQIN